MDIDFCSPCEIAPLVEIDTIINIDGIDCLIRQHEIYPYYSYRTCDGDWGEAHSFAECLQKIKQKSEADLKEFGITRFDNPTAEGCILYPQSNDF